MQLRGKVVLITGASEGIGAACAAVFHKRGARVALVARSADKLQSAAPAGSLAIAGDITDVATRSTIVDRTVAQFGAIDVLVNNAGIGLYAPTCSAPLDDVRAMFELNWFAPLALIQLVVPHMRKAGGGTIVNIGSIAGKVTLPWLTLYSASKYALGSMTDGLRMELHRDGIRSMIVCPGYVETGFQSHVLSGRPPDRLMSGKKFAITPEQCAEALVRGVEQEKRTVVTPAAGWLLTAASRLFPRIVDAQLRKMHGLRDEEA
ncbi:MAG: SDR family NAD(P)-dependent oxidoreductase [Bryobacteraceae bacterium]